MPPKFQKRVEKDTREFINDTPEFAKKIHVSETDMKNIYVLIEGPTGTPYEGGEYIIQLILTNNYPMEPPSFKMLTPSGRFVVDSLICTSFSGFHKETWTPCYNFNTIIKSLISFMIDDADSSHVGKMASTDEQKVMYAKASRDYNTAMGYNSKFI
jgi:ubiquitin-conjugating enzyme E2 J2